MRLEGNGKYKHSLPEMSIDITAECQYKGSNSFVVTEDTNQTTKDRIKTLTKFLNDKAKNVFRKKTLYKRLPILNWLPKYNSEDAVGDLVAGITVGLTVIPQALAYAGIAQLPPAYGLYGSFLGCFIYIFLGSSKDVPMGPTAIASLLTFQTARGVWQRAVLLSFLTGIIELLMGIFGLGFLIDFVSGPVSSGFTSAVALIILTSQAKDILGVNSSGSTFVTMWASIIDDIHNIRIGDTVMGLTCIAVLLLMRSMVNLKIGPKENPNCFQKVINKIIWLICTARNAVLVFSCGAIGYYLFQTKSDALKLIGYVPGGLPNFQLPPFYIPAVVNSTNGVEIILREEESFVDMVRSMGSGLIVVPLIALLENIATCKAFANGKPVDATQELIAIGAANLANSFVSAYPGSGALARGAVNNASGVRTPLGNLYTGTLVILALLFLTEYFYFIPKATLAGIIIAAVIFMVEVRVIKPMWRSKKSDLIPGLSAFVACLVLPLELGILVGIGINVIFILHHAARPVLRLETLVTKDEGENKFIVVTPDRCIIFPSVEFVRNAINKHGLKSTLPVVIDCTHIYGADFTAANVIKTLISDFESRSQKIFFYNLRPHVLEVFIGANSGLQNFYNFENLEREISSNAAIEIKVDSAHKIEASKVEAENETEAIKVEAENKIEVTPT